MALSFSVPDEELSTTLYNRRATIIDNIFQGTPFMKMMSIHGGTRTETGGEALVTPLLFSKSTAVGAFMDYDVLDITPQENTTSALYEWAAAYASISISWTEERRNEGRGRLISLLNTKIDNATISLRDQMNRFFIGTQPGAGSKDPVSISEVIDEAPGADPPRGTPPLGGLSSGNTWWRNQFTSGGAFTVADMNTMWNDCSDGQEPPHFLLTSQTIFEYYENSQVGQIRYQNTDVANAGFNSLVFKSAPITFDPQIGITDTTYFINTNYLKITTHTSGDFETTDFVKPSDQAARTAQILWMGQLEAINRRRLGCLFDITAPA